MHPVRRINLYLLMFFLSEETPFSVETEPWAAPPDGSAPQGVFCQPIPHIAPLRMGWIVQAGHRFVLPEVTVGPDDTGIIVIGAGLPAISEDGLDAIVRFRCASGPQNEKEIASVLVKSFDAENPQREVKLDLSGIRGCTGQFVIECGTGPDGNPCGDWLAVYEFAVGARGSLDAVRARAYKAWRTKNEGGSATPAPQPKSSLWERIREKPDKGLRLNPAFRYAATILERELNDPIPDYIERLNRKTEEVGRGGSIRVLALGCGRGQKEEMLLRHVKADRITLTLQDNNAGLLIHTRERLKKICEVRSTACEINELDLQGDRYDVVLAYRLHRVVELEHVVATIAESLDAGGEFWVVSDYVGPRGWRLGEREYRIANDFFRSLTERYRINNLGVTDAELPNIDTSISTFEGIRSEGIIQALEEHFLPVNVTTHSCICHRLFYPQYSANYDVSRSDDRKLLERGAKLDAELQRSGGRPCILNGVYTPR